jgi:uncharacterized OB-fold protein
LTAAKPRIVPNLANRFFWEGAGHGELMVLRCQACGFHAHPSPDRCPRCGERALAPERMSGRGSVYSFTIVRRAFHPGFADDLPYVLALIELPEQPGLRVVSRVVNMAPEAVTIGLAVEAVFVPAGEFGLALFQPANDEAAP